MPSLLWSLLLGALAVAPARLLRGLRRRSWRRGMVIVDLGELPGPEGLAALPELLARLAEDPAPRGVWVKLGGHGLPWATAQALREALDGLREAGKLVVVSLEVATNAGLLIGSGADRLWVAPGSDVFLLGVGAELVFAGAALAQLGVQVDLEAVGAYKSYGETFTRGFASPPNREAVQAVVDDLQAQLLDALSRRVPPEVAREAMARAPLDAQEAKRLGLIDDVLYDDQMEAELRRLLDGAPRLRSWRRWARGARWQRRLDEAGLRRPVIVVAHLDGQIVHREEVRGHRIDTERAVALLTELAEEPEVRAVVLAVQSPGGSAVASDLIAHAARRLGQAKPVVAALGDVAASGGYYIASAADEIVARPGTITGSIGVVGGKIAFGPALAQVRVHAERVEAGPNSGLLSPWTPFDPGQRDAFRASMTRSYERFLAVVSAGRRWPARAVHPVAQGRVWTGRQALALGLVDRLGGLQVAVGRAAARAGLVRWRVVHVGLPHHRLAALTRLLGRVDVALPPALELVAAAPGQPLALLPWSIDGGELKS